MTDYCPPPYELHYFVSAEPAMAYIRFMVGLLCGVVIAIVGVLVARRDT